MQIPTIPDLIPMHLLIFIWKIACIPAMLITWFRVGGLQYNVYESVIFPTCIREMVMSHL